MSQFFYLQNDSRFEWFVAHCTMMMSFTMYISNVIVQGSFMFYFFLANRTFYSFCFRVFFLMSLQVHPKAFRVFQPTNNAFQTNHRSVHNSFNLTMHRKYCIELWVEVMLRVQICCDLGACFSFWIVEHISHTHVPGKIHVLDECD